MEKVTQSERGLEHLVKYRQEIGIGQLDECWEGVWHLTDPTGPHQKMAAGLYRIFFEVVEAIGRGTAWISINVTDREENWTDNHRCPDGAVILPGNPGRWIGEEQVAFLGAPDLLFEVHHEGDATPLKLPFYFALGVQEVLMVEQRTERPRLWVRGETEFQPAPGPLASAVTGLSFQQGPEGSLLVSHPGSGRFWKI